MLWLIIVVLSVALWVLYRRLRHARHVLQQLREALQLRKPFLLAERDFMTEYLGLDALLKETDEVVRMAARAHSLSNPEEVVSKVFAHIAEPLLIVDKEGYIVRINRAFEELESDDEGLIGQRLEALLPSAGLLEYVQFLRQGGKRRSEEVKLVRGKVTRWYVVAGGLLESSNDESNALLVLHDVTRLRELEAVRTDFVANVSHELRTPVTIIKGFADTLVDEHSTIPDDDRERFLLKIQKNVVRLHRLLEDLLTLSKMEASLDPLRLETVSLSQVVAEIVDNFRSRLPENDPKLSLNLEPSNVSVRIDLVRITQVVENLMDNAIRHGRGLTHLEVSVHPEQLGVVCEVTDDGVGIPERDLPHIFERFYRVDKGRSRYLGGTGLGLSITKHIIQQHGGQVRARSRLGEGATTGFVLPRVTEASLTRKS